MLEQEIKLAFADVEAARQAVKTAGARLVASRRLLDDRFFDTEDGRLRHVGRGLRLRRDGTRVFITTKGPIQPGPVKIREEIETAVDDALVAEALLRSLGFECWFRAEKYREDYAVGSARIALDETPVGTFIEIEGEPDEIARVVALLGCTSADYRFESYPALYRHWCRAHGLTPGNMLFGESGNRES
jgi:adenylate cyclase class 2